MPATDYDGRLRDGQVLTEMWEVEYKGRRPGAPIVATLKEWPNPTKYVCRGEGDSIEESRLALVTNLARAIHEDPDPFGELGQVAHIGQVVKFLEALRQGEHIPDLDKDPEDNYRKASDYYLPDNLLPGQTLPHGWEDVIGYVIQMVCSWGDYYPDEHPDDDAPPIDPPPMDEVTGS